jgi:hypothetical protein
LSVFDAPDKGGKEKCRYADTGRQKQNDNAHGKKLTGQSYVCVGCPALMCVKPKTD